MPLADQIAEYAVRLDFAHLDEATVREVRRRTIDSLACALGAWNAGAVNSARRIAGRVSATPGASYLGGRNRTSPDLAAFVNGILVRYLDYNDTYLSLEPAHPSDNLPAVWAAAEIANCGGREIITAAVLAYEIQCRLCDAASIRAHGWDHVTYGAFSTAAAAAKLLGLDVERITQALNLAGTPNIALRQTRAGELSNWKGCAFANAARNGVFAALLAAEGMTGPAPLFEGEMGFFKQVSGKFELPAFAAVQNPESRFQKNSDHSALSTQRSALDFMINKTSIKFWSAEYHSQSAIHAALQLREQIPDPSAIVSIDIHSFDAAVDIIGKDPEKWRPKTRETADHSLPYCTAVALMDGDVTLDSFSESRLKDETLLELVGKIKVHRDAELTVRYPRGIPNRVTVTLKDGQQFTAENEFPRGHAENPMTDDELTAKFRRLADGILDSAAQDHVLDLCRHLEDIDSLSRLFELFPTVH